MCKALESGQKQGDSGGDLTLGRKNHWMTANYLLHSGTHGTFSNIIFYTIWWFKIFFKIEIMEGIIPDHNEMNVESKEIYKSPKYLKIMQDTSNQSMSQRRSHKEN